MTERDRRIEGTKKLLKSLLISRRENIPLNNLDNEYRRIVGEPLPYRKLDFFSLEDFLRHAKDTVTLEKDGVTGKMVVKPVIDEQTAHINKLVREQRTPQEAAKRNAKFNQNFGRSRFTTHPKSYSGSKMVPYEVQSKIIHLAKKNQESGIRVQDLQEFYKSDFKTPLNPQHYGFDSIHELLSRMKETIVVTQSGQGAFSIYPKNRIKRNESQQSSKSDQTSDTNSVLPDEMKSMLKDKIAEYSKGIGVVSFHSRIKKDHPNFDIKDYGCQSLVQLCQLLPKIFTLAKNPNGDWFVFPTKKEEEDIIAVPEIEENLENAHIVVKNLPANISKDEIICLFENVGEVKNVVMEQNQVKVYMMNASDVQNAVMDFDGAPLDGNPLSCQIMEEAKETFKADLDNYANVISQQHLPSTLDKDKFLEVLVAEVFTPHKFYIQLCQHAQSLDNLMEEIDDFYKGSNGIHPKYLLRKKYCNKGMFCAALYDDRWHRVMLKQLDFDKDTFHVFYVDYGSQAILPKRHLRVLDAEFAQFPSQAFECRLSGVKPTNNEQNWPDEAGNRMLEIVTKTQNQGLVAKLDFYDKKRQLLVISLYDTVTNDLPAGISVKKALIKMGVAEEDLESYASMDAQRTKKVIRDESGPSNPRRQPINDDDEAKSSTTTGFFQSARCSTPCSPENTPWKVEPVLVGDISLRLLHLNGKVYLTSQEISQLFPGWKGQDLLMKMLRLKKKKTNSLQIRQEDYPELFEECLIEGVKGVDTADELRLHPLEELPSFLSLFQRSAHPNAIKEVEKILSLYV